MGTEYHDRPASLVSRSRSGPAMRVLAIGAAIAIVILVGLVLREEWSAWGKPRSQEAVREEFLADFPIGTPKATVINQLEGDSREYGIITATPSDPIVQENSIPAGASMIAIFFHAEGTLLREDAQYLVYLVIDREERLSQIIVTQRTFVGLS